MGVVPEDNLPPTSDKWFLEKGYMQECDFKKKVEKFFVLCYK